MSWNKWRGSRFSRRAFLGGSAAVLTLPWLESLNAAQAAAPDGPVRLLWWYLPCGIVMDAWRPSASGALGTLPRILAPLEGVKDDVLVLTGVANRAADVPVAGDHARGTGSFLTCMECRHTADDIRNGISIDQVVANEIGPRTAFDSLELGTTGGSLVGDCDSGYSCAYSNNISWIDDNTPKSKLTDPRLVFDRLFDGFDTQATREDIERRRAWRTSVLDHALEDARGLEPSLSVSDRLKLDEFMHGVRSLEMRLQEGASECAPGTKPDQSLSYAQRVRAMTDLTVLALECDLTRVVTFMMENGGSYRSFDFIDVSGAHHELSHHQNDANKIESLTEINRWEMAEFAYLVQRLSETEDAAGGTLLQNTVAMISSEISDGDWHNHNDLPVLLAGQGGGALSTGRHKDFGVEVPIADLFIAMADMAGVSMSTFGQDGTRPLDLG